MTNIIDTFQKIESAAHDGDFGHNHRATPSDNQANASNYKVGRTQIYGLNIAIEQPRHSYRTGIDKKTGKRWATKLAAHYGYFSRTRGADGDPVDCFIGFYPQSEFIYVINQYVNGQWDEHKIMIAFPDEHTARKAYLDSYDKIWKGLHSLVPASISQFKWWLKNGNMKKPLAPEHLPYDGLENMNQKITWDSTASPKGMTIDKLLYEIRRADGSEHLLLDSVCMADILEDVDSIMTFDALVTPYAKLERKMNILKTVMERAGNTVKPLAVQISDPFKQNGTAQVAVVFELSDGQSVSIFFHNPDVNPKKIAPADELISWKWLLNKKDITVAAAPEHGVDLNVHNVAMRIMKLAEKNSPAFQKANVNRAAKMQVIEDIKTEITGLETELKDAQHELEVAKVEAEDNRDPVLVRAQAVRRELLPLGYEPSDNGLLMNRVAGDFYISVETKYKAVGGTNFNVKVLNRINASSDMDIIEDIMVNEPGVTAKNIDDSAIVMIGKLSPAQTDPVEPVIVPEQIVTAEEDVIEPEVVEPAIVDPVVEERVWTDAPVNNYVVSRAANNASKIRPLPGKTFSDSDFESLIDWVKSNGWSAMKEKNYVYAIGTALKDSWDDIPDANRTTQHDIKVQEYADKEAQIEAETQETLKHPAAKWIESVFGEDFKTPWIRASLLRFITGEESETGVILDHTWLKGLLALGATADQLGGMSRMDILEYIKSKYQEPNEQENQQTEVEKEAEEAGAEGNELAAIDINSTDVSGAVYRDKIAEFIKANYGDTPKILVISKDEDGNVLSLKKTTEGGVKRAMNAASNGEDTGSVEAISASNGEKYLKALGHTISSEFSVKLPSWINEDGTYMLDRGYLEGVATGEFFRGLKFTSLTNMRFNFSNGHTGYDIGFNEINGLIEKGLLKVSDGKEAVKEVAATYINSKGKLIVTVTKITDSEGVETYDLNGDGFGGGGYDLDGMIKKLKFIKLDNKSMKLGEGTDFLNLKNTDTDPTQTHIDTLQAIVDGAHDSMDLNELLDVIDAAATALIDAGLGEANDDLIGEAAMKWAFLDEQKNG